MGEAEARLRDPPREPSVSVVVATRDRCDLLARALRSALEQSFANTEVIVVDDGSTDGTAALLQRCTDPRLRWISDPHSGVSTARNRGVGLATGDWIAFLDDDDEWYRTFLQRQLATARATGADVVYCLAVVEGPGGDARAQSPPPDPDPLISLSRGWAPFVHCVVMRREAFNRAGGFVPGLSHSEDRHLWLRLSLTARWGYTPDVLAVVHHHLGPRLTDDRAAIDAADRRIEQAFSAPVRRRAGWRVAAQFYWQYRGRRELAAVLDAPPAQVRRAAVRAIGVMAGVLPRSAPSMVRPALVAVLGRRGYKRVRAVIRTASSAGIASATVSLWRSRRRGAPRTPEPGSNGVRS